MLLAVLMNLDIVFFNFGVSASVPVVPVPGGKTKSSGKGGYMLYLFVARNP